MERERERSEPNASLRTGGVRQLKEIGITTDSGVLFEVLISILFFGWLNPFALFGEPLGSLLYFLDTFVIHRYR